MKIPARLKSILYQDEQLAAYIVNALNPFDDILRKNELFFFDEYTDHGIKHIENTLQYIENLIAEDTFDKLTPAEVGVMTISVVLHDIGMHTNIDMFKNMLEGKYDDAYITPLGEKKWSDLWEEYLKECRYWSNNMKKSVFGNPDHIILCPNLADPQSLTIYDRKLIGEFIRRHHCRIAHEIALKGYIGKATITLNPCNRFTDKHIYLAGLVARSHGMNMRDTFPYLKHFGKKFWKKPLQVHVVYLMALLRLADSLQIDKSRASLTIVDSRTFYSPYSYQEHLTHLNIEIVQFEDNNSETILIESFPQDAKMYVKIERLIEVVQQEFDLSWAVLGEVYNNNDYKLKYRRIEANINDEDYKNDLDYIPHQFCFRFNTELSKLLIAPLYGDNPIYGVRELVQNAVDACRECMNDVQDGEEEPYVMVELDTKKKLFTITDTGKGMSLREIENYFLTIGSSYNGDVDWQKKRDIEHLYRTGRFGIGVLAAYLLGPEIRVETRSRKDGIGYKFNASLQDKFIQIDKAHHVACGTKIEIACYDHCIKDFSADVEYLRNQFGTALGQIHGLNWLDWYIGDKPKVDYYCDGHLIKRSNELPGFKLLTHQCDEFGTISWKPQLIFSSYDSLLFCNGFFITDRPNKTSFSLNGLNFYYPLKIPSLHIIDIYNTLPLNLQRNNIDQNVTYKFEPELAEAMFTDLICQLMAINTRVPREINIWDFYYTSKGFTLCNQYVLNKLHTKHIIHIGVWDAERFKFNEWEQVFNLFPNELFHFSIKSLGFFADLSEYQDEQHLKDGLLKFLAQKPNFTILQSDDLLGSSLDTKIINALEAMEKEHCKWYEKWFIYSAESELNCLCDNTFWKKLITQVDRLSHDYKNKPTYIFVENIKKSLPINNFDNVFDKYLHEDPIIPYDDYERKKKFPLIHQDFQEKIKEYKIQYNNKRPGGRIEYDTKFGDDSSI